MFFRRFLLPPQIILLCFIGIFAWSLTLFFHPDVPASSDAAYHASLARNIIQGHGFVLPAIYPVFIDKTPVNEWGWGPFIPKIYSLLLAFFFFIFGTGDIVIALTSGLIFILSIPFLYLITHKLFNRQVAFLASIWYIFNPVILNHSIWGVPKILLIFLSILGTYFFLNKNNLFATGLVFGVGSLVKFQGFFLFLPIIFLLFLTKKFSKIIPLVLGLGIIFLFNHFLFTDSAINRNWFHHVFWNAVLSNILYLPDQDGRYLTVFTIIDVVKHYQDLIYKIFSNFYFFLRDLLNNSLSPIMILYFLGLFKKDPKEEVFSLKIISFISLIVFWLFYLVTYFSIRYLFTSLPLMIILAAGTFFSLMQNFKTKHLSLSLSLFSFFFIILPGLASPLWGTPLSIKWSLERPTKTSFGSLIGNFVKEGTKKDEIIVSNNSQNVVWYGQRKSIMLPTDVEDLMALKARGIPVGYLLLVNLEGPIPWNLWIPPPEPVWQKLSSKGSDDTFTLIEEKNILPEDNFQHQKARLLLYRIN